MRSNLFGGVLGSIIFALVTVSSTTGATLSRQANATLQLPQTPPTFGYTTDRLIQGIGLRGPIAMATPPGETERLFIAEREGFISIVTNLNQPTRTVFLDISAQINTSGEGGLLSLAFHPNYAANGYFFVFYTTSGTFYDRVSRFQVSPENPNLALRDSEVILINQRDEANNHNGGDIHFGPDGYLYISLGDEGGGDDRYANSQLIDKDFFAGILRIDVDKKPGSLPPNAHPAATDNYSVPADNPFVGATSFNGLPVDPTKVRTEFWAVGLRNPWRMSFDRPTGRLFVADVGQGAREEIDIVTKGGNYGWKYREGKIAHFSFPSAPSGFTYIDPIHDYGRGDGSSITGGLVYRGQNLSQLTGAYIFSDFNTGFIWALRETAPGQFTSERIVTERRNIAAFGTDPRNGDVLMANLAGNRIERLIYNDTQTGSPIPQTLAETGAFADLLLLTPNPGIVPYDINVPFWSDGAHKTRWFSIPDSTKTIIFNPESNWTFPEGSVWIKHFEIQLTNGVPESTRRLETRFLVRNSNGVYGVTYRWDDTQQNATLVSEGGMNETLVIQDGLETRTQVWRYPSRTECLSCHTPAGGLALGFNTPQLNKDFNYGQATENQIKALSDAGYFSTNVTQVHSLPALAHPTNNNISLEYRVRSYLAANCVQCHQPGGTGLGSFDTRISTRTSDAGLINGLLSNQGSSVDNRVTVPGSLDHSMLLQRISTLGPLRMPPIGSTVLDTNAIALMSAWIAQDLPTRPDYAVWQIAHFGSTNAISSGRGDDPDADGQSNYFEFLTGHNPLLNTDYFRLTVQKTPDSAILLFDNIANRSFEIQATTNISSLFDWAPINVPSNRPFFPITNAPTLVEDPDATSSLPFKFYRLKVSEP